MGNVVCIGLDLAWSARNRSGGAVIVDNRLCAVRADLGGDEEILWWVGGWLEAGDSVVVAVDAPLRVPNAEGKRLCETLLANQWQKYHAGPYPSNRRLFNNNVRGERLVGLLSEHFSFVEATEFTPIAGACYVCEVFPHPAHVSLFKRQTIIKYKKKGQRTYQECWAGLDEYQTLLRGLAAYDPPLSDPEGILRVSFTNVRGKGLKALEDTLDAVTCAYIASYIWRHGKAGTWIYGNVDDGHILVPRCPPEAVYSASRSA